MLSIHDIELADKRVLIRLDLNVPLQDGCITSDARIEASLASIRKLLEKKAKVMILSHLGRPTEGEFDSAFSLAPVREALEIKLDFPVELMPEGIPDVSPARSDRIVLFENVRFNVGEKKNSPELAKKLASLCDVFVMDAFATAHRAQASTYGVAEFAPVACAGPLLFDEIAALQKVTQAPDAPVVAIVGGAKVSTKLTILNALIPKVDCLIVGGGIANTFLAANNYSVGGSLFEPSLLEETQQLLALAKASNTTIPLPTDVVVASEMSASVPAMVKPVSAVTEQDKIFDIGPETANDYAQLCATAKTIIWNGPVGVFEIESFSQGTQLLAQAIAMSTAYSVAGGGDTVAAIEQFGIEDQIDVISTGGGAFLELMEGKTLPALEILEQRA